MSAPEHKTQRSTTRTVLKNAERDEAIASLKQRLQPGTVVYTVLRSVDQTGMSRTLDLYVVNNNEIVRITWSVAKSLDWTYDRRKEALRVRGAGMDMGHHVVYHLSCVIFGDGSALQHRWI